MASIYEKQSEPLIIQCLFAQRRNYTYAKICAGVYFVVCVALVCFFAVLKSLYKCDFVLGLSIGLSIAVIFAASYINELIMNFKHKAATIQQYIDTCLFASCENSDKTWSSPLSKNDIIEKVSMHPERGFCKNDKWYADYSSQPYSNQIAYCQKENIRWDGTLRMYYRIACNTLLILTIILIWVISVEENPDFKQWISFIPWFLPFAKYLITFNKNMNADKIRLDKLNKMACEILDKDYGCCSDKYNDLIDLQAQIFEHRKKAVLIPNFFFLLYRSRQQKNEELIADCVKRESIDGFRG
ncbi:MAG: S-4TM family putative pore-forming effector [Fibrobacter sp.]|nr:S-4TM family putative pore-forming effector [Fibrobacter sp.]